MGVQRSTESEGSRESQFVSVIVRAGADERPKVDKDRVAENYKQWIVNWNYASDWQIMRAVYVSR